MLDKPRLRNELRARRRLLAAYRQKLAGQSLMRRARAGIPTLRHASNIAFYIAMDGEISLMPLLHWWMLRSGNCYLPVLDRDGKNRLDFIEYRGDTKMVSNRFGIPEPRSPLHERRSGCDLDIIFMPVVGFDNDGRRLGMGGGYYDRTLADCRGGSATSPLLVAVAHDIQYISRLPEDPWDIHPDLTLTPGRIIRSNLSTSYS